MLWFMDTLVTFPAAHEEGSDGISVIESLAPQGDSPPYHVHRSEDEVFHLLEGELVLLVDGETVHLHAGQTRLAPKGVPHTYRVMSEQARWLVITTHGDFERFVREVSVPRAWLRSGTGRPADAGTAARARAAVTAPRHRVDRAAPGGRDRPGCVAAARFTARPAPRRAGRARARRGTWRHVALQEGPAGSSAGAESRFAARRVVQVDDGAQRDRGRRAR